MAFKECISVCFVDQKLDFEEFRAEIIGLCELALNQDFTVKWIDEDGDACTISSDLELEEAFRLSRIQSELSIHIFLGLPERPGMLCKDEIVSIHRKGAKRWRKSYRINGHSFEPKRFNKNSFCAYCHIRIWGLGQQGFKCKQCKLQIHKKCHKLIQLSCDPDSSYIVEQCSISSSNASFCPSVEGSFVSSNGTKVIDNYMDDKFDEEDSDQGFNEEFESKLKIEREIVDAAIVAKYNPKHFNLYDFEFVRVIGRGAYAKVLLVELKSTKKKYALKVIKKTFVVEEEETEWVHTEKNVFEMATNHPFLVGLHSSFQSRSRLFYVMDFVKGGDLMYHMQLKGRLREPNVRLYSAEICLALNFLHRNAIIYRDLKLDNILLDHEGHIKLTDYGMCKKDIKMGETTKTFCGTPTNIAPEILRQEPYTFAVDYWSLGVVMFEMLAGRSPFHQGTTENPEHDSEDYLFQCILEKPIRIPRALSKLATQILKGFLNKEPLERLGCDPINGFQDVQSHPFFAALDWTDVELKKTSPAFVPDFEGSTELAYFPPEFTDEVVQLTPDEDEEIDGIDQSEFDGFDYVNPTLCMN